MSELAEYSLTVADVAEVTGMQAQLVSKLADLPATDPERIPNYYRPRTNGFRDRRFRPADVQAWIEAHK